MLFARVVFCSLMIPVAVAQAQQQPAPPTQKTEARLQAPSQSGEKDVRANEYHPRQSDMGYSTDVTDAPRPVERHRGLKIALGIVAGVVLIGAIVAVGVVNASSGSSNQTGYNDWGTLVVMRR